MSYTFRPEYFYRMPTHFGPSLGPRQGADGQRYENLTCKDTSLEMVFHADPEQLDKLLPPGFVLREPYQTSLTFGYGTDLEWLAGRGYNTFGVSVPATYCGDQDTVHGDLLLVLWENMADPIITGREDLGFAKVYCDIPELQFVDDKVICRASWDGFEFARFQLSGLKEVSSDDLAHSESKLEEHPSEGMLHYKYFPKTSTPGESDFEYAALTPADWPNVVVDKTMVADKAEGGFVRATWEQLPTLVHIVHALSELTLDDCISATLTKSHGGKDLSDQRILR